MNEDVGRILEAALNVEPERRAEVVERECGDDDELRAEVESLLEQESRAGKFLQVPAAERLAPGPAEDADEDEWTGQQVDVYTIERRIGAGGMGTVYSATRSDGTYEQRVALKVVKRGMDTDEILNRFRRERQVMAQLEHPNIARILDAGAFPDGRPYLAMEFVEGEAIDRYCRENDLGVRAMLELLRAVCGAVQHAHRHLVVHRDLKPSNVLVSADGEVKLLDFGIAKVLEAEAEEDRTRMEHRRLTPRYASPELLGGTITVQSDVYSLGVMAFEILTGRSPYDSPVHTPSDLQEAIRTRSTRKASTVASQQDDLAAEERMSAIRRSRELRGDLDWVLERALAAEPEDRYPSVAALDDDLARYLSGRPVLAGPGTTLDRATKFARRHRAALTVLGILFLVICSAAAISIDAAVKAGRAAEEQARQERIALEIAGFLSGALQTTPELGLNPDTKLMDVVRAVLPQLAQMDPSTAKAVLEATLAETLYGLGDMVTAERLILDAIEIARTEGARPLDLAHLHNNLARTYSDQGKATEELAALEAALRLLRMHDATDVDDDVWQWQLVETNPEQAECTLLLNLSSAYQHVGRVTESTQACEEALEKLRRLVGDRNEETCVALFNVAGNLANRGDLATAEELAREAYSGLQRALGPRALYTIRVGIGLVIIRSELGLAEAAEQLARSLVTEAERGLGEAHPVTWECWFVHAWALRALERPEAAEPLVRDALDRQRSSLGSHDTSVLDSQKLLARCLMDLDELEEAERILTAVATRVGEAHASDPLQVGEVHRDLGLCYYHMADDSRALEHLQRSLSAYEKLGGPGHPEAVKIRELQEEFVSD